MNRRNFVKNLSAGVTAGLIMPNEIFARPKDFPVGIQLYTLHSQMNTDMIGTLEKVAQIGYKAIETAGYSNGKFYGYSPQEFRKIAEDLGMIPQSSHAGIALSNIDKTIEDTLLAGMSYLVLPSLDESKRKSVNNYLKATEELNVFGEKCDQSGLKFAYHNHAFEFEKMEDNVPYDLILKNTDPGLVSMQLDLYWIVYGGSDPIDYFKRYPGRFELFHVKDMSDGPKRESTEIGSGTIDFEAIFAEREKAGMKFFFLEQESFQMDPFESISISYEYLTSLTF